MIGFLQGKVLTVEPDTLIIVTNGVGYELTCSGFTLAEVAPNDFFSLWVYTHVREDQLHLFGFRTQPEKQMFLSLIKVNGVGPKMAMGVLSAARYELLRELIEDGDVKGLTSLPKVGKKTAEQIVLSLKGKLMSDDDGTRPSRFSARADITSALVNLGFKLPEVEKVVSEMDASFDVQQGIRAGLSKLSGAI